MLTIVLIVTIPSLIIVNYKLINLFRKQNKKIKFQLNTTQEKVINYAKKLKRIEEIIVEKEKKNEFDTITLMQIKKELFSK